MASHLNCSSLTPYIILVHPTLPENIGAVARAMLNGGLLHLRLVNPPHQWLNEKAIALSSGAETILQRAQVYPSLALALEDIQWVYATTARNRYMEKEVRTPREAINTLIEYSAQNIATALVFGSEKTGLLNEDLTLANELIRFPLNPSFSSVNLAQSVMIMSYEWSQASVLKKGFSISHPIISPPATKAQLHAFFEYLEYTLEHTGYFREPTKRPIMVQSLRNTLQKANLTEQEVRTWWGVINSLRQEVKF